MSNLSRTRVDRVATVKARIGWKALTADEYTDDGYVFLNTPNIKNSSIDFEDVNYINEFRWNESPELKLQLGDVLLAKDGSTLGITNVVRELPRPATVNGSIAVIRPHAVDPRFLMYTLASESTQSRIQELRAGMGVPHLFQWDINRLEVPEVDAEAQRRIADFLDDQVARIDSVVTARQVQGLHNALALDSEWDRIASVAEGSAAMIPIRRVLRSICDGPFGSSLTSSHYSDSGVRVIRLGNIGMNEFRDEDVAYISDEHAHELSNHAVHAGDLVMAGLGDESWALGRCAVVPDDVVPAIVKADCYRIRLDARIRHDFAAWYLTSPKARGRFGLLARGSTRARLNTAIAVEALLPLAGVDEQRSSLAEFHILRIDAQNRTGALKRSIDLLNEYKRSLITAAVTGEFDVSTASGRGIPA